MAYRFCLVIIKSIMEKEEFALKKMINKPDDVVEEMLQ